MDIFPAFPENLKHDPLHQTEFLVYQEVANSRVAGQALYKVRAIPTAPELDFAIWAEDVGCFCIKVEQGELSNQDGVWSVHTADGKLPVSLLITQTWRAAMGVRSLVRKRSGRKIFVIGAIILPDDQPDPRIREELNGDARVSLLWGKHDLIDRLTALPQVGAVFDPPTAAQIAAEVAAVKHHAGDVDHGTTAPQHPGESPMASTVDFTARQVVIHHVDTANLYTMGDTGPGVPVDG